MQHLQRGAEDSLPLTVLSQRLPAANLCFAQAGRGEKFVEVPQPSLPLPLPPLSLPSSLPSPPLSISLRGRREGERRGGKKRERGKREMALGRQAMLRQGGSNPGDVRRGRATCRGHPALSGGAVSSPGEFPRQDGVAGYSSARLPVLGGLSTPARARMPSVAPPMLAATTPNIESGQWVLKLKGVNKVPAETRQP